MSKIGEEQEVQLMLTKPRDAFTVSQGHQTGYCDRYYAQCYSNFVSETRILLHFAVRVRGHFGH